MNLDLCFCPCFVVLFLVLDCGPGLWSWFWIVVLVLNCGSSPGLWFWTLTWTCVSFPDDVEPNSMAAIPGMGIPEQLKVAMEQEQSSTSRPGPAPRWHWVK